MTTSHDNTETLTARGRVLMLAPHPGIPGPVPGPIAKVAYRLAEALGALGYVVDTDPWGRHRRDEGLARKVLGRASDLIRIRRHIRRGSYDLVFVNTTHDLPAMLRDLLLILPSRGRVKWVLLIHGSHFRPGHLVFDMGVRRLLGRASAVLLLSSAEVAEWSRFYPPGRYRLVANALAPTPRDERVPVRAPRQPGVPELLFVGRLIREKGVYELIDAFADVRSRRACRLTVAGEGPELDRLRLRASRLGIDRDVEFTGHLPENELDRMYRRADVLVLPSYSEGLPTVLLEAMSVGLPIVTTRIRGAADHLVEGENALFVPMRESDALAGALDRLLDDEALRRAMGQNNLRKSEDFAPAKVAEVYARVFDEVMGRKDGR